MPLNSWTRISDVEFPRLMADFVPADQASVSYVRHFLLMDEHEPRYAKDQRCQTGADGRQQKDGKPRLNLSRLHGGLYGLIALFRRHARSPCSLFRKIAC